MEPIWAILTLVVLMVFGVPVAWCFAGVLMYLVWTYDVSTLTLLLQGFRSLDSVILLALPLFLPLMLANNVDQVHFGTIVACSVVIGANSPPVAPILYMACRTGNVSIHRAVAPALMMILRGALPVMLAVTFLPALSLFLPRLIGVY
ncbi:TRAP transporter large permease subunit [Leisingera sp.]|uniref:TRAP transporter large permease subunit n=1 Tax=Leisingera sp. TaxID=1879318 RepID=UPI002B26A973|nr:TRAP transporter large permease subunit [Leisingera sp.]